MVVTADEDRADALFHALADRTRRDILGDVRSSESTASRHLPRATTCRSPRCKSTSPCSNAAGLISKRRNGRQQLAHGEVDAVRSIASMLDQLEDLCAAASRESTTSSHTIPNSRSSPMPVTDVNHDLDTRTLTITAEFAAPVERVGRCTPIPASSSRSSGRRPTPPPSSSTT